jgi:hypothetical protein
VSEGGFEQQSANEVVGDGMHPQLALDHARRDSTEDIEREIGFDLAVMQLHLPALRVEFGDGAVGERFFIEQRRAGRWGQPLMFVVYIERGGWGQPLMFVVDTEKCSD